MCFFFPGIFPGILNRSFGSFVWIISEISITIPLDQLQIFLCFFPGCPPVIPPKGFLGILSRSPARFPPKNHAHISGGLFPRISTGTPHGVYPGIFSIISPWTYPAIYLEIFLGTSFLRGFLKHSYCDSSRNFCCHAPRTFCRCSARIFLEFQLELFRRFL